MSSKIKVHPARRPNLSKAGLLTFMSPSGHGLAGLARACQNPGCGCRDILLRLQPIDFRVEAVTLAKGRLSISSRKLGGLKSVTDERWLHARLAFDTGEIVLRPEHDGDREAEALVDPLREALDGELLDAFARLWLREKGVAALPDEPLKEPELGDHQPGEKLAYGQVFGLARADRFRVEGDLYEAVDLYCPDPDCSCRDVAISFVDPDGEDDAGVAVVDLSSGEVSFDHDTDDDGLVPDLWRRFVHRHRGVAHLFDRQLRLKELGKSLLTRINRSVESEARARPLRARPAAPGNRRRSGTKVGRNDPCPCRSGLDEELLEQHGPQCREQRRRANQEHDEDRSEPKEEIPF